MKWKKNDEMKYCSPYTAIESTFTPTQNNFYFHSKRQPEERNENTRCRIYNWKKNRQNWTILVKPLLPVIFSLYQLAELHMANDIKFLTIAIVLFLSLFF